MICSTSAENVPSDMTRPSNVDSNQPVHSRSVIRVFVVRIKKLCTLGYPNCVQRRFWSDCANAQADLNLRWAHTSESTFSDVAARMFPWFEPSHEKRVLITHMQTTKTQIGRRIRAFWRGFCVVHLQIGYVSIYCRTTKAFDGADTQTDLGVLWLQIL